MTDFEGINPYEYQKQAVAMQKQRIAEQPHLKPQIEKAQALTPVTKPRVEAPTMTGAKPTGAERIGAGVAASVGLGHRSSNQAAFERAVTRAMACKL